jgi:uroporphyrinogen decarboxylase
MNVYRELCKRHPSFRERSEVAALSTEISLQPYRAYHPDAVIMFSDILTPLPGMGITFDIPERGPVVSPPVRNYDDLRRFREMDPHRSTPFVRETLQTLRRVVEPDVAVLGFVGAPWTLLTYCIEGGSSQTYSQIKKMAFTEPALLHELLAKVTDNLVIYASFQIECGADAIQIFDSWAGQLSPTDFDEFASPYLNRLVQKVKEFHPETPLILYINQGSHLLERMRETGVDVVSVDWTVDIQEARARLGSHVAVQGNMDPACLLGSRDLIQRRAYEIMGKAGKTGHIMNLGHGVLPETPEENVLEFFHLVRAYRYDEH